MRDDLHGGTEVIAAPFFGNDALIDASGGEVAMAAGGGADKAFVVTQVQVGLGAVIGDEHFAMLKRAHGARIHVDIRIELDHRDAQAARLENGTEGRSGNAFPQRGNHAAGDEYISSHGEHRRC